MSGRKLSSSSAPIPAAKKQKDKERDHSRRSRRDSGGTKASSKGYRPFCKRRPKSEKDVDSVAVISDDDECEAEIKGEVIAIPSLGDVSSRNREFEFVKHFTLFDEIGRDARESADPVMDSLNQLLKSCDNSHECCRMGFDFPACCFGPVDHQKPEDGSKNKIQIIGLGLRLRELL